MRAHFAGDVMSPTGECSSATGDGMTQSKAPPAAAAATPMDASMNAEQLQTRIVEFKQDSKNMEALHEFIDEVLQNAEAEVVKQQQARESKNVAQPKEKSRQSFAIPDFKNGKVVNRARGLVVRLFDAICNCANTAAAPAQRIKLRGKRAASSTANGGSGGAADSTAETALNEKTGSKKQDIGKDKKDNEKKKKKEEEPLIQHHQQQQQQQQNAVEIPVVNK